MEIENKVKYKKILPLIDVKSKPNSLGASFHTYVISFKGEDGICGMGDDDNKVIAFEKALSELLERSALHDFKGTGINTSNGFASHTRMDLAKENAKNELIERDLFLTTWLAKKPPYWVTDSNFKGLLKSMIRSEQDLFNNLGYSLKLGIIGVCNDSWVGVAVLKPRKNVNLFGCVLTTAAHGSVEGVIEKLFLDQKRMVSMIEDRLRINRTIFTPILEAEIRHPVDHTEYYLNPENLKKISWYIDSPGEILTFPNLDLNFQVIAPPVEFQNYRYIVRCHSNDSQKYFIGKTTTKNINLKRLKTLTNKYYDQIHPLG